MDYIQLVRELEEELMGIQRLTPDIIKQCNLSVELSRNLLTGFKKMVRKKGFQNEEEEIDFFKRIKQIPLESLIYHFELKSFEIKLPKTGLKLQRKYIGRRQKELKSFFLTHLDFIQYTDQDKTYLDDRYFTRKYFGEYNITHSKAYYRDPDFSSSHDLSLAKLKAYRRLATYYDERLKNLGKDGNLNRSKTILNGNHLKWTASAIDLTELCYALKYARAIQHGDVTIREIQLALETLFNTKASNPYQNLREMRRRKKDRTKFLRDMTRGLLDKLNSDDR